MNSRGEVSVVNAIVINSSNHGLRSNVVSAIAMPKRATNMDRQKLTTPRIFGATDMRNRFPLMLAAGRFWALVFLPADRTNRRRLNGSTLLPSVDGRSCWARQLRDLIELHLSDLGGSHNTSEAERSLVRRIATAQGAGRPRRASDLPQRAENGATVIRVLEKSAADTNPLV